MKKKSIYVWSLIAGLTMMTACSDSNDENPVNGETATLEFSVSFEDAVKTKAPSVGVPVTSWSNINQIQFMLYDAGGVVRYSKIATVPSGAGASATFTYPDVPTGTNYTLVAVANANGDVATHISGSPAAWTEYFVRGKAINALSLQHASGTFPTYANPAAGTSAYKVPAEIFMGTATGIGITSGNTTPAALTLKREVALMRVRLCVNDPSSGVVNEDAPNGVDWSRDASVLVYNLPTDINMKDGLSTTSVGKNILVGSQAFKTTNPSYGTVVDAGNAVGAFKYWDDIVVFPNRNTTTQQYTIVVSGKGKVGHKLTDGTVLTAEKTVYWKGLVKESFDANRVREVNLTLRSGGSTEIPTEPSTEGELVITVSSPAPWDSNIQISELEL